MNVSNSKLSNPLGCCRLMWMIPVKRIIITETKIIRIIINIITESKIFRIIINIITAIKLIRIIIIDYSKFKYKITLTLFSFVLFSQHRIPLFRLFDTRKASVRVSKVIPGKRSFLHVYRHSFYHFLYSPLLLRH